ADHLLDGVEHRRVMHDLVDPGEQEVRLEIMALAEFLALRGFEILHGAAVAPRLVGGERVDRVEEALAVIMRDLRVGEFLAHGCSRSPDEARGAGESGESSPAFRCAPCGLHLNTPRSVRGSARAGAPG